MNTELKKQVKVNYIIRSKTLVNGEHLYWNGRYFSDNFKYVSHHDSREEAEAVVKDRAVGGEVGTKETWTDFSQPATAVECNECGNIFHSKEIDSKGVCIYCADESKITCKECNEIEVQDEGDTCPQCWDAMREYRSDPLDPRHVDY